VRITGGSLKGRALKFPPSGTKEIRPLRTRVRKALFDVLGNDFEGISVLDLFAGTGALGIEALSRGAKFCLFVDASPVAINLIKTNLSRLNLEDKARVWKLVLPKGLKKVKNTYKNFFDLVFIAPPYETGLSKEVLKRFPSEVLKEDAILVVEERTGEPLPFPQGFELIDTRTYGETTLYFLKRS